MNRNPHARTEAGKNRNSDAIRNWLAKQNLSASEVARRAGLKSHAIVTETIAGSLNNRRALAKLLELGCHPNILSLPKDMVGEIQS
ncbi:MAG: hypothetical protein H7829_03435 [Magnetococcus sp. THC-1_WYH]